MITHCRIANIRSTVDDKNVSGYVVSYKIISSLPDEDPLTVLNAAAVAHGDKPAWDTSVRCNGATADQVSQDGKSWLLILTYGKSISPWDKPVDIAFDSTTFQSPMLKDLDGKPIVNACGDPPLKVVTFDDKRPNMQISFNFPYFEGTIKEFYDHDGDDNTPKRKRIRNDPMMGLEGMWNFCNTAENKINSKEFLGSEKHTVKIAKCNARKIADAQYGDYWEVNVSFEWKADKWHPYLHRNVGLRARGSAGPDLYPETGSDKETITDFDPLAANDNRISDILLNGVPVTIPQPLDKNGKWLYYEVDGGGKVPAMDKITYIPYKMYEELDFGEYFSWDIKEDAKRKKTDKLGEDGEDA